MLFKFEFEGGNFSKAGYASSQIGLEAIGYRSPDH